MRLEEAVKPLNRPQYLPSNDNLSDTYVVLIVRDYSKHMMYIKADNDSMR